MRIWLKLKGRLFSPMAYLLLIWQSTLNRLRSIGKRDEVVLAKPYQGEPILLIALFEKGNIRHDILQLLASAKRQGLYVVCINTLKIDTVQQHASLIDCYIAKYNFGRDFGSYQTGFNYLYTQGLAERCPRLLMVNDSVFYCEQKSSAFLRAMIESPVAVLGATENHEFEHHLGSFCIAMSGSVLRHPRLRQYWASYRCSDIRTRVIQRGEMRLSRTLRACVSSPEDFRALYDITAASEYLAANPDVLDELYELLREDWNPDFTSFSLTQIAEKVTHRYLQHSERPMGVRLEHAHFRDTQNVSVHFVKSLSDYHQFLCAHVDQKSLTEGALLEAIRTETLYTFLDFFIKGSPIHKNSIFLFHIGLPFIKLDGLYRGVFSVRDVETIAQALSRAQAPCFRRLMYARPYGRDTLYGWKRAAFERGLI